MAANGIKPQFGIGAVVRTRRHPEATIVGIYENTAEYVVQTAEYLREHPNQAGKAGGYIVPFETCRVLETAAA